MSPEGTLQVTLFATPTSTCCQGIRLSEKLPIFLFAPSTRRTSEKSPKRNPEERHFRQTRGGWATMRYRTGTGGRWPEAPGNYSSHKPAGQSEGQASRQGGQALPVIWLYQGKCRHRGSKGRFDLWFATRLYE